ncbi:hypothetical protein ABBQ38_011015 [Trebouxia sp. C0009 RCD-2024]
MLVGPDQYVDVYKSIKEELYSSQEKKVSVFVATDSCDSVCATKTLQELQTLILINCGATEDVAKLLDITSNIRVIVIDSHRPFHHNLNDENTNFMAFCNPADGTCDDVPEADMSSDSEEEEEQEFEDDAENESIRANRRQRVSSDSSHSGISRQKDGGKDRRERRHKRREYYKQGVLSGEPATCVLYKLANALHLEDNHLLWLSILGLTDHLVHQRISNELYTLWLLEHQDAVRNSNTGDSYTEIVVPRPGEEDAPTTTTVSKPLYGKISPIDDYRFPLMRHWSLYEAMLHSTYVAVRLQTWHDKGRRLLQEMLVKMGFPAPQFRQKWNGQFQINLDHIFP